jgi:4-carboxymuconolactone decarboxylase
MALDGTRLRARAAAWLLCAPMTPRIAPLAADEHDDTTARLVEGLPGAHLNIVATMLRHPDLFGPFASFAGTLTLSGRLDARARELLTLRTAVNCGSDYEWGQHTTSARAAGILTDDDIVRVLEGSGAPGWSPRDQILLDAADELHVHNCISDGTWAAISEHFDVPQQIEIPMLVGLYHMVAFMGSSLGVEQELGEELLP